MTINHFVNFNEVQVPKTTPACKCTLKQLLQSLRGSRHRQLRSLQPANAHPVLRCAENITLFSHDTTQPSVSPSIHLTVYWVAIICQALPLSSQNLSSSPFFPVHPFRVRITSSPISVSPCVPGRRAEEKENIHSSFPIPSAFGGWGGTNHSSLLY